MPDATSPVSEAAKVIGEIPEEEIPRTVRSYRKQKRAPETALSRKAKKRQGRIAVDTNALVTRISGFKESRIPGKNPSAGVLHRRAEDVKVRYAVDYESVMAD